MSEVALAFAPDSLIDGKTAALIRRGKTSGDVKEDFRGSFCEGTDFTFSNNVFVNHGDWGDFRTAFVEEYYAVVSVEFHLDMGQTTV